VSANGEVIKSFLVGLGFDVDESSLNAFNKSIQTAALRVTSLYGAVNAFAGSMVYAFSKISEGFEEMGYQYHIIAPAINKAIVLRNELLKAYSSAGINIRKVIVDSVHLNMSLTKTRFALEAIYKSVGSKFFGLLIKQSDQFRKKIYQNMPYIISALTRLVSTVFRAFDIVTQLGSRIWSILGRVFDFFVALDKATDGWSTKIIAVIAAWKLLNLSFLATPLGLLLVGLAGILALYDDFKTFKEGGESFFNWGPVIPIIDKVSDVLEGVLDVMIDIVHATKDLFSGNWASYLRDINMIADAFVRIDAAVTSLVRLLGGGTIGKIPDFRDRIDASALGAAGSVGSGVANAAGKVGSFFGGSPLGSNPQSNTSNVNANMQTQINITGSPNSDATARATAGQQQAVNRDMVRNLKGATR